MRIMNPSGRPSRQKSAPAAASSECKKRIAQLKKDNMKEWESRQCVKEEALVEKENAKATLDVEGTRGRRLRRNFLQSKIVETEQMDGSVEEMCLSNSQMSTSIHA